MLGLFLSSRCLFLIRARLGADDMSTRSASKRLRSRTVAVVQQVEEEEESEEEEQDDDEEEDVNEEDEETNEEEEESDDEDGNDKKKKKKKAHVCDTCKKGFGAKSDLQVRIVET